MGFLKKKKSVFFFLIKIPNPNLYQNQNDRSMFPNSIDRFGRPKRETKQQQTGKPRKKISK